MIIIDIKCSLLYIILMTEREEKTTSDASNDEPLYTIGVVSRMLKCDPSTLRRYENAGLVTPGRTQGNTRLYSNNNVETLRMVHKLIDEEKLNAPGVRMVLRLQEEIKELRARVQELEKRLEGSSSGEEGPPVAP